MTVTRPAWLSPVSLVLALVGVATSLYLSYEHLTNNASLVCPSSGPASGCLTVATSSWSTLLGVPVAYLGLLFYLVVLALVLPAVWRRPEPLLDTARVVLLVAGLGFVLYLVWAELFRIHAICTWCTVVHVATFLLLGVVVIGQILSSRSEPA